MTARPPDGSPFPDASLSAGDQPWDAHPSAAAAYNPADEPSATYGAAAGAQPPPPPPPASPSASRRAGDEVSPAEGGFVARERLGPGLGLVVVGSLVALVTLFLTWCEAVPVAASGAPLERMSPFEVRDRVAELGGKDIPALLVPWLLLAVTVVSVVLAVTATIGLRSRTRTTVARIVAWLLVQGGSLGYLVLLISTVDGASKPFVGYSGTTDYLQLRFVTATSVWGIALGVVAWSALIGPRIVWVAGPSAAPGSTVRVRVPVVAGVLAGLGAVCAALAFLAVPWFSSGGESSTFFDIADVIDTAGSDLPLAQAYFGGVGYLVIVAAVVAAVLIALGCIGSAAAAGTRIGAGLVAVAGLGLHLGALAELDSDSSAWSAGVYLVPAGLVILLLAALLPARVTVRLPA